MMEQGLEEDPSTYDKSSNNMGMYMMIMSIAAICIAYGMMEIQTLRTQKRVDKSISGLTKV